MGLIGLKALGELIELKELKEFIAWTNGCYGVIYDNTDGHGPDNKQHHTIWAGGVKEWLEQSTRHNFTSYDEYDLLDIVVQHQDKIKTIGDLEGHLTDCVDCDFEGVTIYDMMDSDI